MVLIKWDESLSVNIAEIDKQHQKLIALINELRDAMSQGQGKTVVGKIINGLLGYMETHFKTEERYFTVFGYPEAAGHKKEHEGFVVRVTEFKESYENGQLALSIDVLNFLSDWLRQHIMGVDKKYTSFFNEKGLK